jgi:hypothetical protein
MGLIAIHQSCTHVCKTAILGFVLAVAVHVSAVYGTTIPPELGNLEVLSEAALTSTAIITDIFGFVAPEQLEFAGTFTDTDWSLALTGNYAGLPVNIVVNGLLAPDLTSGTFTSTGLVASALWTGTGGWSFTQLNGNSVSMDFTSQAVVSGQTGEHDREVVGKTIVFQEEPGFIIFTDAGLVQKTVDGQPVGTADIETSRTRLKNVETPPVRREGDLLSSVFLLGFRPTGGTEMPTESLALNYSKLFIDYAAAEKPTGQAMGTVRSNIVPEPSSSLLFATILSLLVWRRCRNKSS